MQGAAYNVVIAHYLDDVGGKILRVRCEKIDAQQSVNFRDASQQARKRDVAAVHAVLIDVLAEERDLFYAFVSAYAGIPQNRFRWKGDKPSAHMGNDAVGAEIFAAVGDGDPRMPGERILFARERIVYSRFEVAGFLREVQRRAAGKQVAGEYRTGRRRAVRPDNDIRAVLLDKSVSEPLRHASGDRDGPVLLFARYGGPYPRKGPLFGVLADGTRIENHDIGVCFRIRLLESVRLH